MSELFNVILEMAKTYGPVILLLAYFVWQDYNAKKANAKRQEEADRYRELSQEDCESRVHKLETHQREVMATLIRESNDLSRKMIAILAKLEERHNDRHK